MIRAIYNWLSRQNRQGHAHDWEVLDRQSDYQIYLRLHRERLDNSSPPSPPLHESYNNYVRAVCVACGKCVDQIKDRELQLVEQYEATKHRRDFAQKIWNETQNKGQ